MRRKSGEVKTLEAIVLGAVFLVCMPSALLASDGAEWQRLNSEVLAAYRAGDYAKATRAAEEALSLARQLDGGFQRLATSLNNLAKLYNARGDVESALKSARLQAGRARAGSA